MEKCFGGIAFLCLWIDSRPKESKCDTRETLEPFEYYFILYIRRLHYSVSMSKKLSANLEVLLITSSVKSVLSR